MSQQCYVIFESHIAKSQSFIIPIIYLVRPTVPAKSGLRVGLCKSVEAAEALILSIDPEAKIQMRGAA